MKALERSQVSKLICTCLLSIAIQAKIISNLILSAVLVALLYDQKYDLKLESTFKYPLKTVFVEQENTDGL